MRGIIGIVAVVLILASSVCLVGCAETRTQSEEIKILSHSMTTHQFTGSMPESTAVVRGRAKNISNHIINPALIAVSFYDADGNLIDTSSAIRRNLGPCELWDFTVQSAGPDAWKSVSYDIAASTEQ